MQIEAKGLQTFWQAVGAGISLKHFPLEVNCPFYANSRDLHASWNYRMFCFQTTECDWLQSEPTWYNHSERVWSTTITMTLFFRPITTASVRNSCQKSRWLHDSLHKQALDFILFYLRCRGTELWKWQLILREGEICTENWGAAVETGPWVERADKVPWGGDTRSAGLYLKHRSLFIFWGESKDFGGSSVNRRGRDLLMLRAYTDLVEGNLAH